MWRLHWHNEAVKILCLWHFSKDVFGLNNSELEIPSYAVWHVAKMCSVSVTDKRDLTAVEYFTTFYWLSGSHGLLWGVLSFFLVCLFWGLHALAFLLS